MHWGSHPFPISTPPKGYEDPSSWTSFILTQQRYDLLKEVDDFFRSDTAGKGSFLSEWNDTAVLDVNNRVTAGSSRFVIMISSSIIIGSC